MERIENALEMRVRELLGHLDEMPAAEAAGDYVSAR